MLSPEHQRLLRDFLRQADLVKFAGLRASENDIRVSTDLAVQFLEETRENAPWIDVQDVVTDGAAAITVSARSAQRESPAGSKEQANV